MLHCLEHLFDGAQLAMKSVLTRRRPKWEGEEEDAKEWDRIFELALVREVRACARGIPHMGFDPGVSASTCTIACVGTSFPETFTSLNSVTCARMGIQHTHARTNACALSHTCTRIRICLHGRREPRVYLRDTKAWKSCRFSEHGAR